MPTLNKSKDPFKVPQGHERSSLEHDQFYDSAAWRRLRYQAALEQRLIDEKAAQVLRKSKHITAQELTIWWNATISTFRGKAPAPACQDCLMENKLSVGDTLDHIASRKRGGENLPGTKGRQFLCEYHHNKKRQSER